MAYLTEVATFLREMWEDIKQEGTDNLPTLFYFFLLMFFSVVAVYISTSFAN